MDGGSVGVNVNATTWTIGNFTSNGNPVSDGGAGNEDGFGNFNQKVSMQNSSNGASIISFTLTNGSGTWLSAANVLAFNENHWLVAAHIQIQDGTKNDRFRCWSWWWYSPRWRNDGDVAGRGSRCAWHGAALSKKLARLTAPQRGR